MKPPAGGRSSASFASIGSTGGEGMGGRPGAVIVLTRDASCVRGRRVRPSRRTARRPPSRDAQNITDGADALEHSGAVVSRFFLLLFETRGPGANNNKRPGLFFS